MDANTILTWVGIVLSGIVTLILAPLGIYFARYQWDRWRWQRFNLLIHDWAQLELFVDDMTEDDWHVLAAIMLSEARFEPARTKDLIELAVWFAKGKTRQALRGQIAQGRKDEEHGSRESG